MADIKRIALLSGGGDCPGLNAVIRAVTKAAINEYGYEVIGYVYGYRGLYNNDYIELTVDKVENIYKEGGTILYSSNKDNLFDYLVDDGKGGKVRKDVSDVGVENLKKAGVDVLVVLGGDGTLTSARDFSRKGVNVIGIPKTMDNDLPATDLTYGFISALSVGTEFIDRLNTTAKSHHRVICCELMGRDAGWIALYAGMAGNASCILIPEIPFTIEIPDNLVEESITLEISDFAYEMEENSKNGLIKVFENTNIRTKWNAEEEDYYFSVVDVIKALTESPRPRKYWND